MNKLSEIAGSTRYNAGRKVVKMRTKDMLSWNTIAEALEVSPRTARKLFQERIGEHQHHDHLIGKGGRFPGAWTTLAEVPYIVVPGVTNDWERVELPESD